nr:MAG: nonstructural protein [Microvirus sp.]QJB19675.1 MAG: nonstructural protein [Microvirus sp.]
MKAFSIRDIKAEGFNTPFFQATFGLAERAFKEAANDPQSQIAKNKEDFSLYYLGEFDQQTGLISPENAPKHICDAN